MIDVFFFFARNAVMFFAIYLMYGLAYLPLIYVISQTFCTMSSVYSFLTYNWVVFCEFQIHYSMTRHEQLIIIDYNQFRNLRF